MKHKQKGLIAVIVISIIVIVCLAFYFVLKNINIKTANVNYNKLASSFVNANGSTENSLTKNVLPENPIDFSSLTKNNDEIYSWIQIPDTNINYPVCQSKSDDNFYLDHDINKNYKFSGTIYSQSCNNRNFSDRVTVLYGHNMADGSMFANLHKYSDKSFMKSHGNIYIFIPGHKLTYKIVSAFVYDDRHIMNSFNFNDDKIFEEYLDMISNPHSLSYCVNDDINLNKNDKIITLSTCLDYGEGRFLVNGVLINDEQTQ